MAVHVSSEIGQLHEVLVHPPGNELLAVTPSTRADYLYDDMMEVGRAQREHARFVAILERFATVHRVKHLLAEVMSDEETRRRLVADTLDIIPSEPLARELQEMNAPELVRTLIEGIEESPGDRKSTRLNSSHLVISYAVFCLKKKTVTVDGKKTRKT